MTIELLLTICSICTLLGFALINHINKQIGQEPINEMDYDPELDCVVCGEPCDNYEHWTQGG